MFVLSGDSVVTRMTEKAQARIETGYTFPDAPDTHGQWTPEFNAFTNQCRVEIEEITHAHKFLESSTVHSDEYSYALETERLFKEAVDSKDMELVLVYHHLLPMGANPSNITATVKLMRSMKTDAPLYTLITVEHIRAMKETIRAIYQTIFRKGIEQGPDNDEVDEIAALSLQDPSRTSNIIMIIERGIVTLHGIQEALKVTKGIESPLIGGTL